MQENYRTFTVKLHDCSNEELAELFQKTQDEECLVELMQKNKGLIHIWVMKYRNIPQSDPEDLQEEAYIALWRAAKAYDPDRGYTFVSCLKGYVQQAFNRLYTEATRQKRYNGVENASYDELAEINREKASFDDYSGLELDEFLSTLSDTTHKVASLILEGLTNGEIAKALSITPASISYHCKRIKAAYLAYCVEG